MNRLDRLTDLLLDRASRGRQWTLSAEELSEWFDPVDYYRVAYRTGVLGVDGFGPENAGELMILLEELIDPGARAALRDAGLLLSHDDRIDLTGRFVRTIRVSVVLHVPEPETFRAMLHQERRYDRAVALYLDTFLPRGDLVERCARDYVEVRRPFADDRSETALFGCVRSYLELLVRRHVVEVAALAPALIEILGTVARHEGMLPGGRTAHAASERAEERSGSSSDSAASEEARVAAALEVLGLTGVALSRRVLSERYRRLMRRFHPDVNPDGLETAKRINVAYGLVSSLVEAGGS